MASVDFAQLKERVSITDALALLNIELKPHGDQLRGQCPICHNENKRGFVVTPAKNLFFCFTAGCGGGDVISLVAKVKKVSPREAALYLQEQSGSPKSAPAAPAVTTPQEQPRAGDNRLQPLTYLEPARSALQGLGISEETAKAFGAGYAPKGVLRGRLAVVAMQVVHPGLGWEIGVAKLQL